MLALQELRRGDGWLPIAETDEPGLWLVYVRDSGTVVLEALLSGPPQGIRVDAGSLRLVEVGQGVFPLAGDSVAASFSVSGLLPGAAEHEEHLYATDFDDTPHPVWFQFATERLDALPAAIYRLRIAAQYRHDGLLTWAGSAEEITLCVLLTDPLPPWPGRGPTRDALAFTLGLAAGAHTPLESVSVLVNRWFSERRHPFRYDPAGSTLTRSTAPGQRGDGFLVDLFFFLAQAGWDEGSVVVDCQATCGGMRAAAALLGVALDRMDLGRVETNMVFGLRWEDFRYPNLIGVFGMHCVAAREGDYYDLAFQLNRCDPPSVLPREPLTAAPLDAASYLERLDMRVLADPAKAPSPPTEPTVQDLVRVRVIPRRLDEGLAAYLARIDSALAAGAVDLVGDQALEEAAATARIDVIALDDDGAELTFVAREQTQPIVGRIRLEDAQGAEPGWHAIEGETVLRLESALGAVELEWSGATPRAVEAFTRTLVR